MKVFCKPNSYGFEIKKFKTPVFASHAFTFMLLWVCVCLCTFPYLGTHIYY